MTWRGKSANAAQHENEHVQMGQRIKHVHGRCESKRRQVSKLQNEARFGMHEREVMFINMTLIDFTLKNTCS